jgi:hypothetical protein
VPLIQIVGIKKTGFYARNHSVDLLLDPLKFFEKFTVKNVIYILEDIWAQITESNLKNSWGNRGKCA